MFRYVKIIILGLSLILFYDGIRIQAKAYLAQYLIAYAWEKTLAGHDKVKPWPWADTWPVARLHDKRSNNYFYILEGAQGNSLAFGPGHLSGSEFPGFPGVSVVGGHRDTHFRFLSESQAGDLIQVTNLNNHRVVYRINEINIVNSETTPLIPTQDSNQLILVTCYPFDVLRAGGPLRYVVRATTVVSHSSKTSV